jgi:hypothetical protein
VTLRTTFCNDVLFYDLYARTWRRVVECAPRALVLSTRASLHAAPLPRALTAPRAVRLLRAPRRRKIPFPGRAYHTATLITTQEGTRLPPLRCRTPRRS